MSGCIPAVVRSVERSSARGTSDAEGLKTCPFDSKKARYPARSSAEVRMVSIVGARSGGLGQLTAGDFRLAAFLGGDLVTDLLQRPPDQPRHVHLRNADLLGDL